MGDTVLRISGLTNDYGEKRGIFDIDITVNKGEVFGYIGTNGSDKTTTIRNLMGFIKPDKGSASILELDSWKNSADMIKYISYIPGEISFPSLATGTENANKCKKSNSYQSARRINVEPMICEIPHTFIGFFFIIEVVQVY